MKNYFDYIKEEIYKELGTNFSVAVIYAEISEGSVGGFFRYSKANESEIFNVVNNENFLDIVASVRKTLIHHGEKNVWSAIIYAIENGVVEIETIQKSDLDHEDILMIAAGEKVRNKYFPNMPYASDDEDW